MRWGKKIATRWASILGQIIAISFFALGIYRGDYILSLIGVFVFLSAATEYRMVQADFLLQNQKVDDVLRSDFTAVFIDEPMSHVIHLRNKGVEKDFIVVDEWGQIQGVLHNEFIVEAEENNDFGGLVREYLSPTFEPISQSWRLDEVLELFQQKGYSIIPVYNTGRMVGVVDRDALNTYIRTNTSIWQNWSFK
jgi:CBS domain-containing protein